MKSRAPVVVAMSFVVGALMPKHSEAGDVSIQDLGALFPNSNHTGAYGVSNSGVIVGYSQNSSGFAYSFRWENGSMTNIGGGAWGSAEAVNTLGQVVGYVGPAPVEAFSYSSGVLSTLGTLPGGWDSQAYGINDAGLIVGHSRNSTGEFRAVIFNGNGVVTNLGTLGGPQSKASDVNSSGQIVGFSKDASENNRAFLYQNGTMTTLGSLGATTSVAEAINDNGVIVGHALLVNGQQRGFVYENGVVSTIDTFGGNQGQAIDINSLGQVVGWARDASADPRAFLYESGTLTDLNSLLPAGSGWTLEVAHGINDNGWIVGEGTFEGSTRAFLLVIPAPSGAAALLVGLLLAPRHRRR